MNLRHSQSNFQSSMELGVVTEGVKNKPANVWTIMIPWLIGAVMFGGACYSGSGILLHSLGIAIAFSVSGGALAVVHKLFGKLDSRILRVHENGLSLVEAGAVTEIHYRQLDEYCCKKSNWGGPNEHFEFELKSSLLGNPRTISWQDSVGGLTLGKPFNFDELHCRISERVADNMAADLELNEKVRWGKSNFIYENGIECRVKTSILSSEMKFIPWSELRDMKFIDGKLLLSFWMENSNVEMPCGAPNLFAGYLLINRLVKNRCDNRTVSQQTEKEVATAMTQMVAPLHCYQS